MSCGQTRPSQVRRASLRSASASAGHPRRTFRPRTRPHRRGGVSLAVRRREGGGGDWVARASVPLLPRRASGAGGRSTQRRGVRGKAFVRAMGRRGLRVWVRLVRRAADTGGSEAAKGVFVPEFRLQFWYISFLFLRTVCGCGWVRSVRLPGLKWRT